MPFVTNAPAPTIEPLPTSAPSMTMRAHTDQDTISDRTGMKNRSMAATDEVADDQAVFIRDVENRAILDIGFLPDSYLIDVGSNHALKPDTGSRADRDMAEDCGIGCHVNIVGNGRFCFKKPI